jgi:signal transduction histidine kinase
MRELPPAVREYLTSFVLGERTPAYVRADAAGLVASCGGALEAFGFDGLRPGSRLTEEMPALHGLLPPTARGERFASVEVSPGRFADIHVLGDAEGSWVVLLDASAEVSRQAALQQAVNDLELARHARGRDLERRDEVASILSELAAELDALVLADSDGGAFRVLGTVPDWADAYGTLRPGNTVRPASFSPFLENFLLDAEEHWDCGASGRLRSGPWTEPAAMGGELYLEATALCAGGRRILLVGPPQSDYSEKQAAVQAARDLSLRHERLLKELQKKEVLLHCIVHDLRQPLSGISAAASILKGLGPTPEQSELVEICARQSGKLDVLIRSILNAFAGEVEPFDPVALDPAAAPDGLACARETVAALGSAYAMSRVDLEIDERVDLDADWRVVAERSRLERVLWNLAGNALRYSTPGTAVTIGLADEGGDVLFWVDDEGPGVPDELAGSLFKQFAQGTGRKGAIGLGLYFCRISVERWGGSIGYRPRPAIGSRFWFKLRRPAALGVHTA